MAENSRKPKLVVTHYIRVCLLDPQTLVCGARVRSLLIHTHTHNKMMDMSKAMSHGNLSAQDMNVMHQQMNQMQNRLLEMQKNK
jgi:hypothetical protein